MKKLLTSLLIVAFGFTFQSVYAQSISAKLIKNVNVRAQGVSHYLNKTKDTLVLKSDEKINYVYSINRDYKKEVYDFIDSTSYRVPLTNLSEGKHTFVVGQSPLKIVFAVFIYKDEEFDLSSSLSNPSYSTLD